MIQREKEILASFMIDSDCKQYISHLSSDNFKHDLHKRIFSVIFDLYEKNDSVDYINVSEKMPDQMDYIYNIQKEIITTVNIENHIKKIKEETKKEKIAKILLKAYDAINKNDGLDETINSLFNDLSIEEISNDVVTMPEALKRFNIDLEKKYKGELETGFRIGVNDFDKHIQFRKSKFYMIAGRPSHGKTSYALFILRSLIKKGLHCLIFSLEMPVLELIEIMMSSETRIISDKIQNPHNNLSNAELTKIASKIEEMKNYNLSFVDNVNINIDQLCNIARNKKALGKLDFLIVDYLQLIRIKMKPGYNRNLALGEVSRKLKLIAMELNIPVVALGQLSREASKRTDKRPILTDIRDSGEIEQDLDVCMFVYYPYMDDRDCDKNEFEILIRKNRRGQNGIDIKSLRFYGEYQNFVEINNKADYLPYND